MSTLNLGDSLILDTDYSTTEKKTGATWIDGKPIYNKVITFTSIAGSYGLDVSALKIDTLVSNSILIQNVNGNYCIGSYMNQSNDQFNYYLTTSKTAIILRSGADWSYGPGWISIFYTKTTD